MSSVSTIPSARPAVQLPLAFLAYAIIALCWGVVSAAGARSAFEQLGPMPIPLPVVGVIAVFSKVVGVALETTFYWMWWSAAGARIRFGPLSLWIATASLLDVGSEILRLVVVALPDSAPWLAILGGGQVSRELTEDWPSLLRMAFSATGVFTLARIVLTARGQARETGARLQAPLVLTAAVYITSRILVALFFDALRGGSPL